MSRFFVSGTSSFAVRGRTLAADAAGPAEVGSFAASPGFPPPEGSIREQVPRERHAAPEVRKGQWGRRAAFRIAALLVALAAWELSGAAWLHAKAALAQLLIANAWQGTKADGARRPWPWADTRPVARLTFPARNIELYVLAGTSGRSLAFGPGHVDGTALPGTAGNSVIVAHRDTHFAFLRQLREEEEIAVEDTRGRITRYRVREVAVVDKRETRLLDPADSTQLTLITCWPFDAVQPGTGQRFVVIADRMA